MSASFVYTLQPILLPDNLKKHNYETNGDLVPGM